ncbi:MAG: tyrosine-type recombinase/integrase [Planctomycetes bacterium]|nr:tyrosine-type recombinase/integrase [Planctomycetota bacterium]
MLKRRLTDAGFSVKATRTYSGGSKRTVHSAGYSPHSFRVMVVTDLLGQGVDVADVAHLVGHSSTRTTERYNRNQRKVRRNLVERIRVNMQGK